MRYKIILTHNPQDFFEDREPNELIRTIIMNSQFDYLSMYEVLHCVDNGYKAIIFPMDGDGRG